MGAHLGSCPSTSSHSIMPSDQLHGVNGAMRCDQQSVASVAVTCIARPCRCEQIVCSGSMECLICCTLEMQHKCVASIIACYVCFVTASGCVLCSDACLPASPVRVDISVKSFQRRIKPWMQLPGQQSTSCKHNKSTTPWTCTHMSAGYE